MEISSEIGIFHLKFSNAVEYLSETYGFATKQIDNVRDEDVSGWHLTVF